MHDLGRSNKMELRLDKTRGIAMDADCVRLFGESWGRVMSSIGRLPADDNDDMIRGVLRNSKFLRHFKHGTTSWALIVERTSSLSPLLYGSPLNIYFIGFLICFHSGNRRTFSGPFFNIKIRL